MAGCGSSSSAPPASRPTVAQASSCASSHPATWQGCLVEAQPGFASVPISELALPGSHNAGTYNLDPQGYDIAANSTCTLDTPQNAAVRSVPAPWFQTQDETITQQLNQGIRYLDMQVAYNGGGSATKGWRVAQTLLSQFPLYDYLDEVAAWAKAHRSEMIVVDFRNVCYDNDPTDAIAKGLFSNFTTRSDEGGGTTTLRDVAYSAPAQSSLFASATIDEVIHQGGGGHNVVVLMPSDVRAASSLSSVEHVHAVFTAPAGSNGTSTNRTLPMARSLTATAPTSSTLFSSSNALLQSAPTTAKPALGSMAGKGLFEAGLTYTFDLAAATPLVATFGGLIQPAASPIGTRSATLPAWQEGMWGPAVLGTVTRTGILSAWGNKTTVVLADGVEHEGYIPAVITRNGRAPRK